MSCHSLLACRVSAERSAVNLMGIPFCVICCFSLVAFNIFSLYLIFDSFVNMCLGVCLLGFILYGTLYASWSWVTISFPMLGTFSTIISSNIFSDPFFFLFSFWDPYNLNVGAFILVPEVSETVCNLFILFSLFSSAVVIYTILSSRSLIHSSASVILLLITSREFLISFIVLFIIVCLLFSLLCPC